MNLNDAYSILEIPQGSSPAEAKKKYRELTKKYHPDINKEAGAEEKFKKINEAYQVVSTGKSTDPQPPQPSYGAGFDPFNPFDFGQAVRVDSIPMQATISFKDSVLGCKKELNFKRHVKCKTCNGQGKQRLNNGCTTCGGKGQVIINQGSAIMIQTCSKCYGRSEVKECNDCSSQGLVEADTTITVTVPAGIQDGNVLRIGGMGHYSGSFGPIDQHTDVHLRLAVTPEEGLRIVGRDVMSKVSISLLEALQGCRKAINTINGKKHIEVTPKSRNKDEVIIPHLGVGGVGSQRVVLDVQYPDDINQLIDVLSQGNRHI